MDSVVVMWTYAALHNLLFGAASPPES